MLLKKSLFALGVLGMGGLMALTTNVVPHVFGTIALADEVKTKPVTVTDAYARASIGNLKNSAAFMFMTNHTDVADKVISAQSDIAKRVELHTHIKEGDIVKMRKVESFDLPAKGFTDLAPGGHHIMLIGLHKPLKAGDKFPLTLKFEKGGTATVEVLVKSLGQMKTKTHADHHRGSNSGTEKKQEHHKEEHKEKRGSH